MQYRHICEHSFLDDNLLVNDISIMTAINLGKNSSEIGIVWKTSDGKCLILQVANTNIKCLDAMSNDNWVRLLLENKKKLPRLDSQVFNKVKDQGSFILQSKNFQTWSIFKYFGYCNIHSLIVP